MPEKADSKKQNPSFFDIKHKKYTSYTTSIQHFTGEHNECLNQEKGTEVVRIRK